MPNSESVIKAHVPVWVMLFAVDKDLHRKAW